MCKDNLFYSKCQSQKPSRWGWIKKSKKNPVFSRKKDKNLQFKANNYYVRNFIGGKNEQ